MRAFYGILNRCFSLFAAAVLISMGFYGGYALWDNRQVVTRAEAEQEDLLRWKPRIRESAEQRQSFDTLRQINPDVTAWLTMDGTGIDTPVLHSTSNLTYLNTDIYGEFSLAGSVFLDMRNDGSFQQNLNLLYGHHMESGAMFGDLDRYRDPEFFRENGTGRLILPDGSFTLQVYACLVTEATDNLVFDPLSWEGKDCWEQVQQKALCTEPSAWMPGSRTLALSTCASDFGDARTVVLARMIPEGGEAV